MSITRAWIILGLVTAVTAATALVKNKIAAVMLGPEGIGIFAQVNVFITFVGALCTLGMGQGIVKHLAERNESDLDGISPRNVIGSSLFLQVAAAAVIVLVILILQYPISAWVFGEPTMTGYVIVAAAAVPAGLLYLNVGYFLQGSNLVTRFSIASGINAIAGLVFFIVLVWLYGLDGAVLSLLATALISVAVFALFARRRFEDVWNRPTHDGAPMIPTKAIGRSLLLFGLVAFIGSFLETFNALILRSWIVNTSGPAENGIYQAVVSLSGQYIGFFTLFNTTYLLPKISGLRDVAAIGEITNRALQIGFLFLTPLLSIFLIFRNEVILALFTPAFLGASGIIVWQVLGDFLKVLSWSITASLIPMGRLRGYALLVVVFSLINLPLSFALLYRWQTIGIAIAYFITYAIYIVLVVLIQKRAINLRFAPVTLRLTASSAFTLLFAAFFPNETPFDYGLKLLIVAGWGGHALWEMREYVARLRASGIFSRIRP